MQYIAYVILPCSKLMALLHHVDEYRGKQPAENADENCQVLFRLIYQKLLKNDE